MGAPNAATIERFAYSALKPQVSRQIQLYSLLILAFRPVRHRSFQHFRGALLSQTATNVRMLCWIASTTIRI